MDVEGGSLASLARVGLGSLRPNPAGWERWGRGHPVFSAGRGLMGPPQGVCRVRPSPWPAAPPWRGGDAELPRAGAGRAPRVLQEGWKGARPGWGSPPALLRSSRSRTGQSVGAGGVSGRARAALCVRARGAPDSRQLRAHSGTRGSCGALLACLSRVSLVNRPDLLPRLNA